eukprot:IDg19917t1
MDAMISEKNDEREARSDGSSNSIAELSQSAVCRRSHSLTLPRELACMKMWQCSGWNSAHVITSVRSSMFRGLMSTTLKPAPPLCRFHTLTRRSSAERKVSSSDESAMELMWYACEFEYTRRGVAEITLPRLLTLGSTRFDASVLAYLLRSSRKDASRGDWGDVGDEALSLLHSLCVYIFGMHAPKPHGMPPGGVPPGGVVEVGRPACASAPRGVIDTTSL